MKSTTVGFQAFQGSVTQEFGLRRQGANTMAKEQKTPGELEAMILAELNNSSVSVLVYPNPAAGWYAMSSAWGELDVALSIMVQQVAERLRAQYDLK